MKIYGEKAEQSEMIYPQNVQKWYTESGLFPLWITGGGTAVISFEGLKLTKVKLKIRCSSSTRHVRHFL